MSENGSAFVKPATGSIDDILAKARPAERVVRICLRGDLLARRDDLEQQITEAAAAERARVREGADPERSLAEADPLEDLRDELRDVLAEMKASYQAFRFRALPRSAWDALRKQFEDAGGKLDTEGLAVPVIADSSVEPRLSREDVAALFEVFNADQRNDLFSAAWDANTGAVDVPFSPASLAGRRRQGDS